MSESTTLERQRAGYAGIAGVSVALGFTELFAGMFASVPSAMSSIGAIVIDISPPWLQKFAIETFGTQDKLVLGIGIFVVAALIGMVLGRRSVEGPMPIIAGFAVFGAVGIATQMQEAEAAVAAVVSSTLIAMGIGIAAFYLARMYWVPKERDISDDATNDIGRRRVLLGFAAVATVTVVTIGAGRMMLQSRSEAQRAALVLPIPLQALPDPGPEHDFGLAGVAPVVVSNATFYRIDTALTVPAIDPEMWSLRIHGMVDEEVTLTYADIEAMNQIERYVTLACVSNEVGGRLVGNALWTGVLLKDVLELAGVQPGAEQLVSRSVDGWTSGFPVEHALGDAEAMIATGMNREVLPTSHGFPARLVVPGLYGYVSATKWLEEIELTTWDGFDGYWIPRGWDKEGPILTQARIDRPKRDGDITAGSFTLGGVAWAPTRRIDRVEVQIDDGPWMDAELAESLSDASWRLWKIDAEFEPGDHTATVRATDGTGATQTDVRKRSRPGAATGHHKIAFTAT
jgi:DMSO/TMAO reductase YedYZ molybdopterin-dependent catalytic subunit